MHIENEVKYDFSDVLIKPKRSYYTSRKEVDLERKFTFKWSSLVWKGIPVAAATMVWLALITLPFVTRCRGVPD